jgi:hypothetical protein
MYQISSTFIEIDSVLYKILRRIRETHEPLVEVWREYLNADRVFKRDGFYFFVEEVPEAEIVL